MFWGQKVSQRDLERVEERVAETLREVRELSRRTESGMAEAIERVRGRTDAIREEVRHAIEAITDHQEELRGRQAATESEQRAVRDELSSRPTLSQLHEIEKTLVQLQGQVAVLAERTLATKRVTERVEDHLLEDRREDKP